MGGSGFLWGVENEWCPHDPGCGTEVEGKKWRKGSFLEPESVSALLRASGDGTQSCAPFPNK